MPERKMLIGLPVYNGQKFLPAALDSHLSQSFGDFDLLISDNGSTDATQQICLDYARRDPRIKYVRSEENRGILWNHRRVFDDIASPAQYFRWAAGDDILEPGLLQAMVDVLDSRPEVHGVAPNTKNIDAEGEITGSMGRALDLQSADVLERARLVITGDYQMVIAFGLFRAGTLQSMRTRARYLGWDFIFIWELALRGLIVQSTGPVLLRRYHAGAMHFVKTVAEMKKWVEPKSNAGLIFPHWLWAWERFRTLLASPMSQRDRLRVGRFLARATVWERHDLLRDLTWAVRRGLRLTDKRRSAAD